MSAANKITVVLVDDSSVIRGAVSRILKSDPNIEIVGSVANGELAILEARSKKPHIMILDVEMPVLNGLEALPKILQASPDTKVIMFSGMTAKGADTTIKAFTRGAVECLVKPTTAQETGEKSPFRAKLLTLVRTLGRPKKEFTPVTAPPRPQTTAAPKKPEQTPPKESAAKTSAPQKPLASPPRKPAQAPTQKSRPLPQSVPIQRPQTPPPSSAPPAAIGQSRTPTLNKSPHLYSGKPEILAIGSSTGGPQALFTVLSDLGSVNIPIVITQHMPETFTKILAEHITQKCAPIVAHEGADGMVVEPGKAYVAPGGKHMLFEKNGPLLKIKLNDGPEENFCKPAVDPMMRSLIELYGNKVLCTILTGMGHDGLEGARMLVEKGGRIIAQDEQSSVVWGMPGAVAMDGICSEVLPISEIGAYLKKAIA